MDQKQRGILIVFSGFSGSGKGTVMKELMNRYEEYYALSISATTRQPRDGEADGREYFFKTRKEFEKMIEKNELIEYALYVENYYGTPKAYVEEQLEAGKDVILEIEIQGALKIKELFPDTLLMFVTPPDAATLKERLIGRGTEPIDVVNARLSRAFEESLGVEAYDYLIVNDALDVCVEEVHSIIRNEHQKVSRNQEFINRIKEELKGFSKGE
ncbi:guanylate kinase [Roseburia sp. BX1005]|uniref:Guanylate kinase n=1 Tax=Roseburia zhanii TaxID=2763064 RepID=A0A923LNW3_9FIRM|nr:guanylate kinase [Roseburia zhanii]MBC5713685.1 guanylate kinase [Roseburia zhanii]